MKLLLLLILVNSLIIYAQQEEHYELTAVSFHGNDNMPTSQLQYVCLSKESPSWVSQLLNKFTSFGAKATYFDSLLIPSDIRAMRSLYQSKGYFKVKFFPEYKILSEKKEAELIYNIQEGNPATFRKFEITGIDNIGAELKKTIFNYVKVDSNQQYSDNFVTDKSNFVLGYLRDNGYMLAQVDRPLILVDTLANKVDVKLNFSTGKRYRISEIRTERTGVGKNLVSDTLLKRLVGIKPGQTYSYYDIQRGQVRLYRTNLFTSAIVNSIISDTNGNKVPLSITADVGLLNELSPEVITNNEDNTFNIGLGLSYTRKNFFGNARKFTLSSAGAIQNFSEFLKTYSFADSNLYGYIDNRITIEQPFLFDRFVNTKFETYLTFQKRKSEYKSTLYGAKLSLDFELPQFTYFNSFSAYLNIEHSNYIYQKGFMQNNLAYYFSKYFPQDVADSLAAFVLAGATKSDLTRESLDEYIGFSLGANKTNNIFFPTTGYSLSLLFEDANSIPLLFYNIFKKEFNRPAFLKILFTGTYFLPIYDTPLSAFGVKFRIGNIFVYKGNKGDIPLNQRFYSGGSNSIRGWGSRELVPSDPVYSLMNPTPEELEALFVKGATTGGFFTLEGSVETRNRLIGKFGSAVFIDYGNTWNGYENIRLDQIAVAGGFGLRYYSEFAPIRIDFGFKLYDPNDNRNFFKKKLWSELLQFHIGIGEAF
ncbi:outer membrane protein assembly factor [Melioribacteraceae bacterium 4301-Me]|uniref:BamA/OMP85 family outer membrane protein n=1 Tax=Pyranulibacter aquaticus TaxID=3163344 RepID=UPI003596B7CB